VCVCVCFVSPPGSTSLSSFPCPGLRKVLIWLFLSPCPSPPFSPMILSSLSLPASQSHAVGHEHNANQVFFFISPSRSLAVMSKVIKARKQPACVFVPPFTFIYSVLHSHTAIYFSLTNMFGL